MTVGVINNWDTLNVTGTIRPVAVETDALTVAGSAVQPAIPQMDFIADATNGTDVITQLNTLLAALQTAGLMASE